MTGLVLRSLECLALFLIAAAGSDAARILGLFAAPSESHLLIHCSIADALAQVGHQVTVIGTMPLRDRRPSFDYIEINVAGYDAQFVGGLVARPQTPLYRRFGMLVNQVGRHAHETLAHPTMQQFLRDHDERSFDLLVLGYFLNDFHLGVAAHFKCPIVMSIPVQPISTIHSLLGNPHAIAYVPSLFSGYQQPMAFAARVRNFAGFLLSQYGLQVYLQYSARKYYDIHFPSDRYPSLDEVKKNVSLVFTNHHFSQGPIRPNVPAIIEIGGIQIKEKPDPLPADIAKVLDDAKRGAIYFSLGSNVQGDILPKEKAKIMFNVLSKLPYRVLWKWGDSEVPGTSANIVYKNWLPQDDILAHKNIKLFITHGGQGSVVESQYHGVPMVGIPLFGDQNSNMANVAKLGYGLSVDFLTMTEQSFREAIVAVLEDPKYASAVKTFSTLYRDRPMTPRQLVVYWVEYVLRHKGAKHMQSPAVHMSMFELLSLDVIGSLLAFVVIVSAIFVKICKLLCCRGRKGSKKDVPTTKKNK